MKFKLQRLEKGSCPHPEKRRGVALVSVLSTLTLATILVVAYLATATSELKSSALYNDGNAAQQMAETAVNLVINQIREATHDPKIMWMSQPGMVRTYDSEGNFSGGYKLYSDDTMVVDDEELRLVTEDPEELRRWADDPARWTDLNEPVIRGEEVYYPIADPAAANNRGEIGKDYKGVEGFRYSLDAFSNRSPLEKVLKEKNRDPLPMPVQWLYQLKDGTLGYLDRSHYFIPLMANGEKARKENPIVARVAFWADDECSKINLNTASEPTFWDTPRAAGRVKAYGPRLQQTGDRRYGWSQPAMREYQRFPGHPATTALSTVLLPGLHRTADPWIVTGMAAFDARKYLQMKEYVYRMAPKIQPGGSFDATSPHRLAKPVQLDRDRLYPNVDEYLYQGPGYQWSPNRGITYDESSRDRKINAYPRPGDENVIPSILPHARFFLTANSRAPEVNLFGMPRVSMWPTHVEQRDGDQVYRTAYDDLIRFCAKTGSGDYEAMYHFQRENSDSPFHDWTEIERNREVFEYLKRVTSEPVPGYGGKFSDKFGDDHEQVLTEIFDYIRSTNLYDDYLEPNSYSEMEWLTGRGVQYTDGRKPEPNPGNGPKYTGSTTGMWGVDGGDGPAPRGSRSSYPGHGQVTPIEIEEKETKGFGRFYTVSEVGLLLICNADAGGPHPDDPTRPRFPEGVLGSNVPGNGSGRNNTLSRKLDWHEEKQEKSLQAALLLEMFTPSQGWTQIQEDMSIRIEVEEEFEIDGEVLDFPMDDEIWQSTGDAYNSNNPKRRGGRIGSIGETGNTNMWGGTVGFWALARQRLAPHRDPVPNDGGIEGNEKNRSDERRRVYPFISVPLIVNGDDEKIEFGGGRIRIEIRSGTTHSQSPVEDFEENPIVQTIIVEFPESEMPIPNLAGSRKHSVEDGPVRTPEGTWEYTLDRKLRGRPPRPRTRGGGVFFPSYWWSLTRRGCGIGDPEHGHSNWGSWRVNREDRMKEDFQRSHRGRLVLFGESPAWCFHRSDVVRTMVPRHGDYRLIASKKVVPAEDFVPHRFYHDPKRRFAHHFTGVNTGVFQNDPVRGLSYDHQALPLVSELEKEKKLNYLHSRKPDFPQTEEAIQTTGDFDNGVSITTDGAYINKPDEGNGWQKLVPGNTKRDERWTVPYYEDASLQSMGGPAHFSPNRQVMSPVMFGSLPTGAKRGLPWQTLLFRPQKDHPGAGKPAVGPNRGSQYPADHLLLDLFWMPVVEPYAISEPFSTAGKINLNYQMLPFTHIERSTGLRAVLKSEEMLAIPLKWAAHYKRGTIPANDKAPGLRRMINLDETLRQFEERFRGGGAFRTASEICDVHLVPDGFYLEDMERDFWKQHALTGDNSRERPYANVYPRLTAKSNTFRVHYTAQTISKAPISDPAGFDPLYDSVTAVFRGSTLIERYIEPGDPELPDYAKNEPGSDEPPTLEKFYKVRVISSSRFAP